MNIKKTINFTQLRAEGVSVLDIKDDEVVKVTGKNGTKCIIDEKYLHELIKNSNLQELIKNNNFNSSLQGSALNSPVGNYIKKEISNNFEAFASNMNEKFDNLKTELNQKINNKENKDD